MKVPHNSFLKVLLISAPVSGILFGVLSSLLISMNRIRHQSFTDIYLDFGWWGGLMFGVLMGLVAGFMARTAVVNFPINTETHWHVRLNSAISRLGYKIIQDTGSEILLDTKSWKLIDSKALIQVAGNQVTITGPAYFIGKLKKKIEG